MTIDDLVKVGFLPSGSWRRDADRGVTCGDKIPDESGVYLFVRQGRVEYVGSALKSLSRRMRSYERRQRAHDVSRLVHRELAKAIGASEKVEVYVRSIPSGERIAWNGLPVSVLLGVEAALIAVVDPPWNSRGRMSQADIAPDSGDEDGATTA